METLLLSSAFLLSVWGQPVYASQIPDPPPIVETIEQQIVRVAIAHNIATSSLYNLAMSESSLGIQRVGDRGKSCGVVHFHKDYYPEEFSRCDDDEYILTRAAEMIAGGEGWKFTPGNCYATAKLKISNLPKMEEILPNTIYPSVGGLIIFDYNGLKHIAVVQEVRKDGILVFEGNFIPYTIGKRLVIWDDPKITGFWRKQI